MDFLRKTLLISLSVVFLSLILSGQKVQAVDKNPDWIIHQPPYYGNGKYYVLTGQNNIIKFGICGDHAGSNVQLSTKIADTAASYTKTTALQGDYTKKRSEGVNGNESGVDCNDGAATEAYGPKIIYSDYNPAAPDHTATLTVTYLEQDGTTVFASRNFNVEAVAQIPAGATGTSWNPSSVNIATLTNMINIDDIFSGNRFDLSDQVGLPTPEGLVQKVADVLLILAGILAVIAFIWSGYQFIMSSGDSAKVEKAKKAMISAFIGVVLIIFAYSIIRAVDIFSSPPKSSSIPEAKFE